MSTYDTHTGRVAGDVHRGQSRLLSRFLATPIRLGREASVGDTAATPAILVAGIAICMWTFAALLITVAVGAAALLTD
jgi:hypothetical protein